VRGRYAAFLERGTIDPSRISVIPSAYRADLFHEDVDGAGIRRELDLPPGARVAGVAGRLVLDKGHIHLLRAAAVLASEMPDLHLVFAGQGPNEEALRAQARELGLHDRVRFLGFRTDIAEVEAGFDVAVLPSVGCDASSASIKEAMALGVPVIASDIGGARNIIDDGVTGLVVEPGNSEALAAALRAIFDDPRSARSRAERAVAEVRRRFSVDRLAVETLEGYTSALQACARRRGLQQERGGVQARKPV
jgi:glycosyltransferase involved in cell wall biosynthesis